MEIDFLVSNLVFHSAVLQHNSKIIIVKLTALQKDCGHFTSLELLSFYFSKISMSFVPLNSSWFL